MSTREQPHEARTGPFEIDLAVANISAFAVATEDPNPLYLTGQAVPPTYLASMIYRQQATSMGQLIATDVMDRAVSGVHGQHEIVLHRTLIPGERLTGFVEPFSIKPARDNVRVTFRHPAYDEAGDLVAEQWWTTVLIKTSADPEGPDLPDHSFPDLDRTHAVAEDSVRLDAAMVERYAKVTGDYSDHHFDLEAAQRSGMEDVFLHGLCTMALCARAAVRTVANGDPDLIERFALRFAQPAYLDRELDVRLHGVDETTFALEALCGEAPVVRNGLVVLRSAR